MTGTTLRCTRDLLLQSQANISIKEWVISRKFTCSAKFYRKFLQFAYPADPGKIRFGYLDGCRVIDVNAKEQCYGGTMLGFLQSNACIQDLKGLKTAVPIENVILKAPIHGIDKILCVGLNFKDHCEQHKLKPTPVPMIFSKFASTIIGPCDPLVIRTQVTQKVDWEVEMCIVMGKKASCVKADDAYNYVFGCTIGQDISARDWQRDKNCGQFLLGKSMDTFCPIGPYIVTLDEIGDPEKLDISCSLNGVCKQKSNTNNLIHKIPQLIERLSLVMTLLPGDIIMTGTPGGVGMYSNPPEFLKPGDVLRSEVEKIGCMETQVVEYC